MEPKAETGKKNKYTVGKYLRKKKSLRKKDSSFIRPEKDPKLEEYLNYLKSQGAVMNKVAIGRFKIKNGLEYTGVYATEEIPSDQILMEIPRNLLLTTRDAWFSPLRDIFKKYPDYYSPYRSSSWEDRMLLTYIVYEHGRGKDSKWYYLIENLPKEIDYAIFWNDEELKMLEDAALVRQAKKGRADFEKEAQILMKIAEKHPEVLKKDVFTYENIKWIYIHLVTRCFGKYFENVTMVPMAELFNHECTDVYYDFRYEEDNPNKPNDQNFDEPKTLTQEEMDDFATSDGTYDSNEPDEDSDFEYDKDSDYKKAIEIFKNLKKKEEDDEDDDDDDEYISGVSNKMDNIRSFFATKLNWVDSMTVMYMNQIINQIDNIQKQLNEGKMSKKDAVQALDEIEYNNVNFKNSVWRYYKEVLKKSETDIKLEQFETIKRGTKKEEKLPANEFDEDSEWKTDKFDHFIMKASWKDQFEKDSQVFFCYGRLSNRMMLMRYGMTLEYNKYDHVHFKIPYLKYLSPNGWLLKKIKYYKMSRFMKFKVKRRKFELDLLSFCKAVNWQYRTHSVDDLFLPKSPDLELKGLNMMKELFEDFFKTCKYTEDELEKTLTDPKIGYHEYFAVILNLERQRCVRFHYKAVNVLIEIQKRLKGGAKLKQAVERVPELESEEQYHRNRLFFENYVNRLAKVYPN